MTYTDKHVTLIAALDYRNAIGKDGAVPWYLAADLRNFREITRGGTVLMGRKTWDSLPAKFRPLPERENWILSRTMLGGPSGYRLIRNPEEVLSHAAEREIFVIGGGEVYKLFFRHATRLILTHVKTRIKGADTFFPRLPSNWSQTLLLAHPADARNDFAFSVVDYHRIGNP